LIVPLVASCSSYRVMCLEKWKCKESDLIPVLPVQERRGPLASWEGGLNLIGKHHKLCLSASFCILQFSNIQHNYHEDIFLSQLIFCYTFAILVSWQVYGQLLYYPCVFFSNFFSLFTQYVACKARYYLVVSYYVNAVFSRLSYLNSGS
jgi:hypothetical protein